jgi:hypothetical protein
MGTGFGVVGLADLLHGEAGQPGPPKPHHPPKVKHVIFLFLNGGMSQVDTFDYKPMLAKYHGKPLPSGEKITADAPTGSLLQSPFAFRKGGQSGIEVADIFPKVRASIDDFCVINSMFSDSGNHAPALFMMNTGHILPGRPSMGAWTTYGLGTENANLPGFIVMCPGQPVVGPQLWSSAFLPNIHEGVYLPNNERSVDKLVQHIRNTEIDSGDQRRQLDLVDQLSRLHMKRVGSDPRLESIIQSTEDAFRMQMELPDALDIGKESDAARAEYGDTEFGRGCLMARRLVEKGVRMVQVYYGNRQPWDNHEDINDHAELCRVADNAISALVSDLKTRGLLNETLVVVGTEFGRTPAIELRRVGAIQNGRGHNRPGYTVLLAGGGIKSGLKYGATDDFGVKAIEKKVSVHDLHATMLHLLGIDHKRLTYRHSGRDFRLTDVHGEVVNGILS